MGLGYLLTLDRALQKRGSSLFRVGTEGTTFSNLAAQKWPHVWSKEPDRSSYGWTAFPSKPYKYGLPMGF